MGNNEEEHTFYTNATCSFGSLLEKKRSLEEKNQPFTSRMEKEKKVLKVGNEKDSCMLILTIPNDMYVDSLCFEERNLGEEGPSCKIKQKYLNQVLNSHEIIRFF